VRLSAIDPFVRRYGTMRRWPTAFSLPCLPLLPTPIISWCDAVSGAKAAARMMDRYKSDRWRKDAASTVVATFLGGNLAHPGAR
jgi:hypothetical protein